NQTRIIDLPWQEIMRYLMILLAFLMISPVPYPAWPKVGVRSWRGLGGLVLVVGIVIGATMYSKYFFFLFGLSYVAYGLIRAVVLALLDLQPSGVPRRRADDYVDPMESYGMRSKDDHRVRTIGDSAAASDGDDGAQTARRRRRRRQRPPGSPGSHGSPME
ncbi:MAG: hypothetical protein JO180_08680, partial [Gemmatirosa sp.]|nr:hypothetical protein [Gemmatirosa sp.]